MSKLRTIFSLFLLLIIPGISCGLLWRYIAPVTVWQAIAMILLSILLYFLLLIGEIILLFIIGDMLDDN